MSATKHRCRQRYKTPCFVPGCPSSVHVRPPSHAPIVLLLHSERDSQAASIAMKIEQNGPEVAHVQDASAHAHAHGHSYEPYRSKFSKVREVHNGVCAHMVMREPKLKLPRFRKVVKTRHIWPCPTFLQSSSRNVGNTLSLKAQAPRVQDIQP